MKRLYTLIVLFGLAMSALLAGCAKQETTPATPDATNAAPTAPPSTNK